ncbi:conserved hypothetical protein [Candidatus Propionivibrio aalborgensis]|uniref:Transposase IS66 central domain-containing protein n=1 Tax=Candidatus Propionivibrio aalborgensis TaxID=1860101 RepID=A0A1A8XS00_9RHOO|nr:conserved hypothetical protein [Candidatus Propionivibrio aalborgensis]
MWAYRSNDLEGAPRIVVFDYQTSRSGQHARNFLLKWRGHLMVDDYGGYKASFRQGVIELACLAHCRRKFFDLHVAGGHAVAEEALRRIGELYAVEAKARDGDEAARLALRQQEALPKLNALHDWLIDQRLKTADGSGLARAIDYSLKRWPALTLQRELTHRQQYGRERDPADYPGAPQLALHRVGTRWPPCRRDPELARHRQTQRVGTLCLAQGHLGKAPDLALSPD